MSAILQKEGSIFWDKRGIPWYLKCYTYMVQQYHNVSLYFTGLSTLTHWAFWTLFLTLSRQACNLPHECETSRHTCKISRIKEKITLFFFCLSLFLKLKPIHNLTEADTKRTAKYYYYYYFHVWFLTRQAILKSWQSYTFRRLI